MARSRQYQFGRVFFARLPHKGDLLESLTKLCAENELSSAFISAIGALENATVGFYDQKARSYKTISVDEPLELASFVGNLSIKDGQPMVHAHVVLSTETGETIGGHLMSPTIVFAGEVFAVELCGEPLVREFDEPTGLALWAALR
ncbi:MAG: DNA-binding protein [Candidatus Hydrogenedentes bacterium]|nr:DNA-binding protein [Candidatus Hydrogenedentota bacterium]